MTDHTQTFSEANTVPSWLAWTFDNSAGKTTWNLWKFWEALKAAQIDHIRSSACAVTVQLTPDMLAVIPEFTAITEAMKQKADMLWEEGFGESSFYFAHGDHGFICHVSSEFGGDWDDGADDPLDDLPFYDHSVSLRFATNQDLGIQTPEEVEHDNRLVQSYRQKMDAFRRSGESCKFCETTRIRFHGQLDRVLEAVQAYEFPEEQDVRSVNDFGHVDLDGETVWFSIRDFDEDGMEMMIYLNTEKYKDKAG